MSAESNPAQIIVRGETLYFAGKQYRCAIGKGGFTGNKKEGDGATPLGIFSLRECWYRPDRMPTPQTKLPLKKISKDDGWCDDPQSNDYNHHIKLPFALSHEILWREGGMYNLIIPLGYNDDPVIAGKGSAIFLHVAHADYKPTEGCVALAEEELLELIAGLSNKDRIKIGQK